LLNKEELALIDVGEEAPFAEEHPLFAANISLSRLELEVYARVPRRDTRVTVKENPAYHSGFFLCSVDPFKRLVLAPRQTPHGIHQQVHFGVGVVERQ
jgi:hypothetical protein